MKNHKKKTVAFAIFLTIITIIFLIVHKKYNTPIKIGILLTKQEQPIINAILFAIDEINAQGGVNHRNLVPIFSNTTLTTPSDFTHTAEHMIINDTVSCLIGCRDFISRNAVRTVVEKHDTLLLYPCQSEGLEDSPNIIYLGTTPNQQIIPVITWACSNFGKKITIVGADTFFTHIIHTLITYYVTALKNTILQSHFFSPDSTQYDTIIESIKKNQPDVIINIVSEHNQAAFFKKLYAAGFTPQQIPLISVIFSDNDLALVEERLFGSYISKPYFELLKSAKNKSFIESFRKRFPHEKTITTSMQTAYAGIHLWAQAVKEAKSTRYSIVQPILFKQTFDAPEGPIAITEQTRCCWHTIRINKIIDSMHTINVWDSKKPVEPLPYPPFNTKRQWHLFLQKLTLKGNDQ